MLKCNLDMLVEQTDPGFSASLKERGGIPDQEGSVLLELRNLVAHCRKSQGPVPQVHQIGPRDTGLVEAASFLSK